MIDDEAIARRWLVAVVAVLVALGLHLLLYPTAGPASHMPFFFIIGIVAVVSGRAPAVLALGSGIAVAVWRVIDGSTALPDSGAVRGSVLFAYLVLGVLIIFMGHRARSHAQESKRATKAEFDLWRSSQELRTLLDLIPAGVAVAHDTTGNNITVSPRFARMLQIGDVANASATGDQRDQLPYRCMREGVEIPGAELPMQVAARTGREVHDFEIDLRIWRRARGALARIRRTSFRC
jgi:PAS domain-containing protein